jgi:hypothetical protein
MSAAAPIALALMVAGGIKQGIDSNNEYRAAASADDENARRTILSGEQDAWQTRLDERRQTGDMLASMGGQGYALGSGSAGDVIGEAAYQRELEILNIRTKAAYQAQDLQAQAAAKRKAGRSALFGSLFGAAATALSGASQIHNQSAYAKQSATERSTVLGGGTVPRMRVLG